MKYLIHLKVLIISSVALFVLMWPHGKHCWGAEIIYTTHKYILGDNDTKSDARKICFLEAKREALEKAGTYMQSKLIVQDFVVTKDEIKSYSAAFIKAEIEKEEWKIIGESLAIILTIKAEVDLDLIQAKVKKVQKDDALKQKIIDQQKQMEQLENEFLKLRHAMSNPETEISASVRAESDRLLNELDQISTQEY